MEDEQGARVVRYYNASHKSFMRVWSGQQDRAIHFGYYDDPKGAHPESLLRMNAFLADLAEISDADTVVDAGCGYGGSTVWLAAERGCTAIGVNISPHQVALAKAFARDRGVEDRASFHHCDYAQTPLPADGADVFWALESTVHTADRGKVFAEAFRLLRPGGRIVVVEYCLRSDPPLDIDEFPGYAAILEGWAMPSLWTVPQIEAAAVAAGFADCSTIDVTDKIAPSLRRMRSIAATTLPVTRLLKRLGWYDPDRVAHARASVLIADALLAGRLSYAVLLAIKPYECSARAVR